MRRVNLKLGRNEIPFDFDEDRFQVLGSDEALAPLTDREINKKLDEPINSKPVEEIVSPGETVLIVVSDATRQTAAG